MTDADVEPAAHAILADDWGDRRAWFEFALRNPACHPIVADVDGEVVGTGVTTVNGPVAWVGTIWVAPGHRRRGLGVALTEGVFSWAREHGYATIVVDWRVPNLLSSRFWPARGFRTSFVRLHRAIG